MFGRIHGKNVVGYSFADPDEPRVVFEREQVIADLANGLSLFAGHGPANPYLCFSKSELEDQIRNLSLPEKQSPKGSPAYYMQISRVEFARYVVAQFEEIKSLASNSISNMEKIVVSPELLDQQKVLAVQAVAEHTRKAAEKHLETLPNPYVRASFLSFTYKDELKAIFSTPENREGYNSITRNFNKAGLIDLHNTYLAARSIFHAARPDHKNPYSRDLYLMDDVLNVLSFFENRSKDTERFCSAICALSGKWEIDDDFYKDTDDRPLFKLHVDCDREEYTLYLNLTDVEELLKQVLELEKLLKKGLFNKLISPSFLKAANDLTSRISMIRRGFITVDHAQVIEPSTFPNFAF